MYTYIVEQLEAQVIGIQSLLCSEQKQMHDLFKTVADAIKDVSLTDSLDIDDLELEWIDTTLASDAVSALMRHEVTSNNSSTTKCPYPLQVW